MKVWWCETHKSPAYDPGLYEAGVCWAYRDVGWIEGECVLVPMRLIPDNAETVGLEPDPVEVRSYVYNGLKTGWSEDYPVAAQWLAQFADLLDALALYAEEGT